MGCFLDCFGKDGTRRNKRNNKIPKCQQRHGMRNAAERGTRVDHGTPKRATVPVDVVPEQTVPEEQFSTSPKKRVTFDSNVKTYEPVQVFDSTDSLLGEDRVREEFKENVVKLRDDDSVSGNDSNTSSAGSYPQNHRYQNCRESDDEAEEYGDSDLDDDDDGDDVGEIDDHGVRKFGGSQEKEVWSESGVTELTGLLTKKPLVRMNSEEVNSPFKASGLADEGNGVKAGYARDRSTYVHPVLNPVENLSQWKAAKSKGTPLSLKAQKENSAADFEVPRMSVSSEPSFKHLSSLSKPKPNQLKNTNQDTSVDASLSNWLVSPETTPVKKTNRSSGLETITSERSGSQCSNSPISFEDRPILGVLTVEELRYMSATISPRKSPSHSPDDMPIIGTVGTYWNNRSSKKDSDGSISPFKGNKSAINSPRKSPTHSPDDMAIIGTVGTYWNDTSSTKDSAPGSKSSFKGIPNTTSKYREDKKVEWHSTPFETRLERALNSGGAAELD
ncbi:RNA processing factor [Lithospermum erythrorhizon]|uniref:RNA processing factor n=1 Tax=Lithospermum erythrorhizon TaxID=34254 RepID=A0AAV3PBN1_LITER